MARRNLTEVVAQNIAQAMAATGNTPESVASATNIPLPELRARLAFAQPFTFEEVANVGGFLGFRWSSFFEGAAA